MHHYPIYWGNWSSLPHKFFNLIWYIYVSWFTFSGWESGRRNTSCYSVAYLNLQDIKGTSTKSLGMNSRRVTTLVAWAVLAWQLSLMSAIAVGKLVSIHMKYNRISRYISGETTINNIIWILPFPKKNWAFEQGVEHRPFKSVSLPFQGGGRSKSM